MSSLDHIKDLVVKGDKDRAVKMLVSSLQLNGNDIDAWLLLGEVIDDPAKKKDCYNQVLKLSPNNPLAVNGLINLSSSNSLPAEKPETNIQDTQPRKVNTKELVQDLRSNFQYDQSSKPTQSFNNSKDSWKEIGLAILGIGGFFGISYFIGLMFTSGDSSSNSSPLCTGMMCLGLIGVFYLIYNRKPVRVVSTSIQEQQSSSGNNKTVSCRACKHTVSRTAPSCPNCGELYPGLISKCPNCNSINIRIAPKGFSLGKAAAGAVIAGPIGVAGGLHGRKDLELRCSSCQLVLTIKHDEIK